MEDAGDGAARRSSCCTASRRRAAAGSRRSRRSANAIARSRPTSAGTARRPTRGRSTSRPCSADVLALAPRALRARRLLDGRADRAARRARRRRERVARLALDRRLARASPTPASAAPAARPTTRSPIASRGRGSRRSLRAGRALPLFAGQPPAVAAAAHADAPRAVARRPRRRAARPRHRRRWSRCGSACRADDPGHADRRRARREVPRDRRADGGRAAGRARSHVVPAPATPSSSEQPEAVAALL